MLFLVQSLHICARLQTAAQALSPTGLCNFTIYQPILHRHATMPQILSLCCRALQNSCYVTAGRSGLLASASVPADRRSRQLHNTRLALQAATSAADSATSAAESAFVIAPEGLMDGERAATLRALWLLFCQLQAGFFPA